MAILAGVRIHILPFVSVRYVFSTAYTVKRGLTIGKRIVSTAPAAVSHALYNLALYAISGAILLGEKTLALRWLHVVMAR